MRQWKMGPSSLSSSSSLSLARISGWKYGAVKLRGRRECVRERKGGRKKGGRRSLPIIYKINYQRFNLRGERERREGRGRTGKAKVGSIFGACPISIFPFPQCFFSDLNIQGMVELGGCILDTVQFPH